MIFDKDFFACPPIFEIIEGCDLISIGLVSKNLAALIFNDPEFDLRTWKNVCEKEYPASKDVPTWKSHKNKWLGYRRWQYYLSEAHTEPFIIEYFSQETAVSPSIEVFNQFGNALILGDVKYYEYTWRDRYDSGTIYCRTKSSKRLP